MNSPTAHVLLDPIDVPVRWRVRLRAAGEPLLLPRVLQKITVPEIELQSVGYETDTAGTARIELTLHARPARARLAAARLEKIVGMQAVTLEPAD